MTGEFEFTYLGWPLLGTGPAEIAGVRLKTQACHRLGVFVYYTFKSCFFQNGDWLCYFPTSGVTIWLVEFSLINIWLVAASHLVPVFKLGSFESGYSVMIRIWTLLEVPCANLSCHTLQCDLRRMLWSAEPQLSLCTRGMIELLWDSRHALNTQHYPVYPVHSKQSFMPFIITIYRVATT